MRRTVLLDRPGSGAGVRSRARRLAGAGRAWRVAQVAAPGAVWCFLTGPAPGYLALAPVLLVEDMFSQRAGGPPPLASWSPRIGIWRPELAGLSGRATDRE